MVVLRNRKLVYRTGFHRIPNLKINFKILTRRILCSAKLNFRRLGIAMRMVQGDSVSAIATKATNNQNRYDPRAD